MPGADTEDTNVKKFSIGVLGAGTWGMALARMLTVSGNDVQVWSAIEAVQNPGQYAAVLAEAA